MRRERFCLAKESSQARSREELVNFSTHFFGFLLSLVGVCFLLLTCADPWQVASCLTYSFTLIGLYGASSLYHFCRLPARKAHLQVIDHLFIYLFIAGSYTPLTLGPLRPFFGWELFFLVWTLAIGGVFFKVFAKDRFQLLSLLSYLLMGWLVSGSLPRLKEQLSSHAFFCFLTGGFSYTFGTLFFLWEALPFAHAIWHLFVLFGSLCHYFAILDWLQRS